MLSKSKHPDKLEHVWVKWRNAIGRKLRKQYKELVNVIGFTNGIGLWLESYEALGSQDQLADIWSQLRPLYEDLHAYVRGRLTAMYGEDVVSRHGPVPAHLLGKSYPGNMWAQNWTNITNINDICKPFPDKLDVDVTEKMKEKVKIKQCAEVNAEYLIVTHHEMGHVQCYLQYKDQPIMFRDGANSVFHEAVGVTLVLPVQIPKHLKKTGLLDEEVNDPEGIRPPQVGSEVDFDAGAEYHIPGNMSYIRYFVACVIQFQFHKAQCEAAGQYDPTDHTRPLYRCDIYGSTKAGQLLK
ncbi:angiotensin-converting enzyme-like [Pollicipes pollicipes]|uniref:angiotensin-converting enzyme-like n=1 Tax=Pollicipes pollicipes TaxID=41117 RepID=UPI0018858C55|nr:angiotensin-converting enzyme-like [Pollicipes pollicipes]